MRGQNLWQDVYEERGADQAQKDPHWPASVRLFRVWEKVWTTGSPEEAHQDPFCTRETVPVGHHRLPALSSASVLHVSLLSEGIRGRGLYIFPILYKIKAITLRKWKRRNAKEVLLGLVWYCVIRIMGVSTGHRLVSFSYIILGYWSPQQESLICDNYNFEWINTSPSSVIIVVVACGEDNCGN